MPRTYEKATHKPCVMCGKLTDCWVQLGLYLRFYKGSKGVFMCNSHNADGSDDCQMALAHLSDAILWPQVNGEYHSNPLRRKSV